MFVSIMSEQKVAKLDESDDVDAQTKIVKDIKNNVASLQSSMDQILQDMAYIRITKLEILEKLDRVKNEKAVDGAQINITLGKAMKLIRKSEENRRKLEIVLRKMDRFNCIHTFTNSSNPTDCSSYKKKDLTLVDGQQILSKQEKIKLCLLKNNKYMLATDDNKMEETGKVKSEFKWGKDSALKELQWLVKMKLYKLRYRYDKLPQEQEVEERMSLPVSWRRMSEERA